MVEIGWVPIASTFGLAGAIWQVTMAVLGHREAMQSFLQSHNHLITEQEDAVRRSTSLSRPLLRRRRLRAARGAVSSLLTADEWKLVRGYDLDAVGWSLVVIATVILTVVAWVDFALT